eukprot:SAG22_NODE_275_length_13171_cov_11.640606_14_plen_79_part_00
MPGSADGAGGGAGGGGAAVVKFALDTGRTHQIRVHAAHLGHPLLGDATYGGAGKVPRAGPQTAARQAWFAELFETVRS